GACPPARRRTSCTAATPRPASSPASQANVASPCTDTSPPPPPVTSPTPGAISAAPAGSSGKGSWVSIPAIIHPIPPGPATALIISGTGPPRPRDTPEKRGETGNKPRPGPKSGSDHTPSASRYVRSHESGNPPGESSPGDARRP